MKITRGFHAEYQTAISDEIELARELRVSALLRWGMWKLPRMLRTDPAAVLGKMAYCRVKDYFGLPCGCVMGVPCEEHTRATNEQILTPSHPEWTEFQQRLEAELVCPDFDDYYGAAQVVHHDSIHTEYWPLCSAQLVAELGFAVAETLCLFACFLGDTDENIVKHVESMWTKTLPSKIRPAFDRDPLTPFVRQDATGQGSSHAG